MLVGTLFSALVMLLIAILMFKSLRKVDLSELWLSEGSNRVSSTKFWSNIAYFVATVAFLAINFVAPGVAAVEWIWTIYLGVVGGSAMVNKLLSLRFKAAEMTNNDDYYGGHNRPRPRRGDDRPVQGADKE